jgi:hypothetical protein
MFNETFNLINNESKYCFSCKDGRELFQIIHHISSTNFTYISK